MDTVLITGASRGLGRALHMAFIRRGDCVIPHKRNELGDIRDQQTIKGLAEIAAKSNVNVLVNNAGVYNKNWMSETNFEEIREIVEVNLLAPMLLTKALWPLLIKNSGTVININSMAGRSCFSGEIAYRASKFGLTGFSSTLFFDGKKDGVRVLDIPLSAINTDMVKNKPNVDPSKWKDWQQPEAAANLILQIFESFSSYKIKHPLLAGQIIDTRANTNGYT